MLLNQLSSRLPHEDLPSDEEEEEIEIKPKPKKKGKHASPDVAEMLREIQEGEKTPVKHLHKIDAIQKEVLACLGMLSP